MRKARFRNRFFITAKFLKRNLCNFFSTLVVSIKQPDLYADKGSLFIQTSLNSPVLSYEVLFAPAQTVADKALSHMHTVHILDDVTSFQKTSFFPRFFNILMYWTFPAFFKFFQIYFLTFSNSPVRQCRRRVSTDRRS